MLQNVLSPPEQEDPDRRQQAKTLWAISLLAFVAGLWMGLVNLQAGFVLLALSLFGLAAVSILSLWSICWDNLMIPGALLSLSALIVLTFNLIFGGSLREPASLAYPIVIIFASLLLGKRAALIFAGLSILSQALVFYAASAGFLPTIVTEGSFSGFLSFSFLIVISAGLLWYVMDTLERSLKRMRSSSERWRSLVENAPVTIVNTDRNGIIQFVNRFEDVDVDQVIGKPLLDFTPAIDQKRALALSRRVLRTGERAHFEAVVRNPQEEDSFYSVSVGPIFNFNGKVGGLTFIVLDITEKRRSEDEIHRLNVELARLVQERTAQLETSNQELASLSYSVSHDLRTPLRAIDGFSQALLEDYDAVLDAQGKDYLSRVRAASQRMGVLIDDLLRLAAIARQQFQSQTIDFSALATTLAHEFQVEHPDHGCEFIIQPGLIVCGDKALLRIALEDLFSNAWKFTHGREDARIEFGCQQIEGLPTYFVRDNGIGFDMQYASKLFQPFQHLHGRSELEGSGVGLAIVQRIVQKHGGQIWAEAQEDQGATFYFTLSPC